MPAITAIEIENFRCFKKLRVDGLSPVTLIVGANNAGKTALLEAIEAVVSESSPFVLYRSSFERGEFRRRPRSADEQVDLDISHWFHGHRGGEGATFRIRATGARELALSRTIQRRAGSNVASISRLMLKLEPPGAFGVASLFPSAKEEAPNGPADWATLPLAVDGSLGAGTPSSFMTFGERLHPPVSFLTTDRLLAADLARLWAGVVLTTAEARTVEAMQLVEPAIERIAIAESEGTASARVLLRGAPGPVPLGTLGEGVSRILALALHLATSRGGFLLVDELENGLHWSIMPSVWRFLVETARAFDVQVFATTHSKDCLEGLAELRRTYPALAQHASVHRLQVGGEMSTRFDAARVADYLEMELETR